MCERNVRVCKTQACDFLIAVAEPSSRPQVRHCLRRVCSEERVAQYVHEYQLTPYSLLAAVSIGLKTDDIVTVLGRLSKNELPAAVADWVRDCTR
jgi:DNA excision repair protein ERCC-3